MMRLVGAATAFLAAALLIGSACDEGGPGSGSGGSGGGCPTEPVPVFLLHVTAQSGNLPPDTRLRVTWSATEEPEFVLDDPSTWLTLEDETLVECDVDRDASAPLDLEELVCELWTGGTIEVVVSAHGYVTAEETFTPTQREGCDTFVTTDVSVELRRDLDAGVE